METRVALIGIIVENSDSVEKMNALLHEYGSWIIGRMGVPYRQKGISIISVVIDAPMDKISSLSESLECLTASVRKPSIPGRIRLPRKTDSKRRNQTK